MYGAEQPKVEPKVPRVVEIDNSPKPMDTSGPSTSGIPAVSQNSILENQLKEAQVQSAAQSIQASWRYSMSYTECVADLYGLYFV